MEPNTEYNIFGHKINMIIFTLLRWVVLVFALPSSLSLSFCLSRLSTQGHINRYSIYEHIIFVNFYDFVGDKIVRFILNQNGRCAKGVI